MAYIKVDHSRFEDAASAIDSYISLMKRKMASAQNEVDALSVSWQGKDYAEFKNQWDKIMNGDSVYKQMLAALESFSGFLRHAKEKYLETQASAINSANGLPKY